MDDIEKKCFNLWIKNNCTWDSYLISRKIEKIIKYNGIHIHKQRNKRG